MDGGDHGGRPPGDDVKGLVRVDWSNRPGDAHRHRRAPGPPSRYGLSARMLPVSRGHWSFSRVLVVDRCRRLGGVDPRHRPADSRHRNRRYPHRRGRARSPRRRRLRQSVNVRDAAATIRKAATAIVLLYLRRATCGRPTRITSTPGRSPLPPLRPRSVARTRYSRHHWHQAYCDQLLSGKRLTLEG